MSFMTDTPLNPDALEAAAKALLAVQQPEVSAEYAWNVQFEDGLDELRNEARAAVSAYFAVALLESTRDQRIALGRLLNKALRQCGISASYALSGPSVLYDVAGILLREYPTLAVAQPVVTGEQINLAGWTCDGIHEPGDYSTCEECRDACDDLARFYNHMMQNPRPFKHWTGRREVNDA